MSAWTACVYVCDCLFAIGVASEIFCLDERFAVRFLWQPSHVYFYNKVSLRMFGDKLSITGLYTTVHVNVCIAADPWLSM